MIQWLQDSVLQPLVLFMDPAAFDAANTESPMDPMPCIDLKRTVLLTDTRRLRRALLVLAILAVPARLVAQQTERSTVRVNELARTPTSVTLQVDFPELTLEESRLLGIEAFQGAELGEVSIPLALGRGANIQVRDTRTRDLEIPSTLALSASSTAVPLGSARYEYGGVARGLELSSLKVQGMAWDADQRVLRQVTSMQVIVSGLPIPSYALTDLTTAARKAERAAAHREAKSSTSQALKFVEGIRADDGKVHKLVIKEDGIYQLTYRDLKEYGLDLESLDLTTLRIVHRGVQVPVYVFDRHDGKLNEGDYIEFWGERPLVKYQNRYKDQYFDPYTEESIYYLVWGTRYSPLSGKARRLVEESGEVRVGEQGKYIDLKDSSFRASVHIEENTFTDLLVHADINEISHQRDNRFASTVSTGASAEISGTAPFPDVRKNSQINVRVGLHGLTYFDRGAQSSHGNALEDIPNEHQATISLNGNLILRDTWDSQKLKFIATDTASHRIGGAVPSTRLLGTDFAGGFPVTFTIQNTNASGNPNPTFALNWIDLEYDRTYTAFKNRLAFRIPHGSREGMYQFTLARFTRPDISIYRKGISRISNIFISATTPDVTLIHAILQLPVTSEEDEFIALTEDLKLKPFKHFTDDFLDLRNTSHEAEYLILTSRKLLRKDEVWHTDHIPRMFAERAQAKGMSVKIVDVANIYDEFNHGQLSPIAIRDFLRYAYKNWRRQPKYVSLLGRSGHVPSPYIQSFRLGSVPGDVWYAMVDGEDFLPDLILGRVPAETSDQLFNYISKLRRYDSDPDPNPEWKNRTLYISGNTDLGGEFPLQITNLLRSSSHRYTIVDRLGLNDEFPYYGNYQTLIGKLNAGVAYVQFMGHGGFRSWDDYNDRDGRGVLLLQDVPSLDNEYASIPFVSSLTCFTGNYEHPDMSLVPAMVISPKGGAIGGFATASFGFRDADQHIALTMMPIVTDTIPATWGERIYKAKIDYYLRFGGYGKLIPQTLTYAYIYLGDPTAPAYTPEATASLSLPNGRAYAKGDKVVLEGKTSIASGRARIELVTGYNSPLPQAAHVLDIAVQNGSFTVEDFIPLSLTEKVGTYKLTVVASDGSRYAVTSEDISFDSARITQVQLEPRYLVPAMSNEITASVQVPQGVLSVSAEVTFYERDASGVESQIGPVSLLPMTQRADRFVATLPGTNLRAGMRVTIRVLASVAGGQFVSSQVSQCFVGAAADPAAYPLPSNSSLQGKVVVTSNGLHWQQPVYNWGSVTAENVRVDLLDFRYPPRVLSTVVLNDIPPRSTRMAYLPFDGTALDSAELFVRLYPEGGTAPLSARDSLVDNDTTDSRKLTLGALAYISNTGSTLNGAQHATIVLDSGDLAVDLGPGALDDVERAVIKVDRMFELPKLTQPDITLIAIPSSRTRYQTLGYRLTVDSLGAVALSQAVTRTISIRAPEASGAKYIYLLDDRRKVWSIQPTTRQGDMLVATVTGLGTFAVGDHRDQVKPLVDMTVEGQVFVDNGEVPEQPRISVVLQDANGIDISEGKLKISIDGRPVPKEEWSLLDSARTTTSVNIKLDPTLTRGKHTILTEATDNNGLTNSHQLAVNVSNQFVIQELGVYPNPFATVMFVAYEIKGIPFAESVDLSIYTVSGKKIKTLEFPSPDPEKTFGFVKGGTGTPTSLGYHEIWWDGRDDEGQEVANGVYFYRLRVATKRETKEITGKLARIR